MAEVVILSQTLHPFSDILNFSRIRATIVAPLSDGFQIYSILWKALLFPEKTLQTLSKAAYKCRRSVVGVT